MAVTAPYGSWDSPITPTMLTHAGIGLSEVAADDTDLYWLEFRPTEAGRTVIAQCWVTKRTGLRSRVVKP